MIDIAVVVGNPRADSRTRDLAERVVQKMFLPGSFTSTVIELSELSEEIFRADSERMESATALVAQSDVVVVATPTYKASYTGLLKAFLDRYDSGGLAGVVALPVHSGGDRTHALAPNESLLPLLVELGCVVPGRGCYIPMSEPDRLDTALDAQVREWVDNMTRLARLGPGLRLPTDGFIADQA